MHDELASKLARIMTHYSAPVEPGDVAFIRIYSGGEPFADALTEAIVQRGGYPVPLVTLPNTAEILLEYGNDQQLAHTDPLMMTFAEKVDVNYRILSEPNTRFLGAIDPARTALYEESLRPYLTRYRQRKAEGKIKACVSLWPTHGLAQDAGMGLQAYRRFMFEACGLSRPDPLAYWQGFRDRQLRYIEWMAGKEHLEISGPGIDLAMSLAGRTWLSAHGEINFPDGEVYTGPVEDSVNGTVSFNYPSVYQGRRVEGARLVFKDGKVTEASASMGEDFLRAKLDMDAGARRLGEFAIGTNYDIQQFTGNTLFDEKIGGTIHMALGRSYPESGGQNDSVIHWDSVHDMAQGEMKLDGEVFYRNGQFVI